MTDYDADPDWRTHIADAKKKLIDRASRDVLDDVLRGCPVSADGSNGNPPGYLRDHQRRAIQGDSARVGSDVDYSVWVDGGHRVAYRGADGETVYTGSVVPPQPFLESAAYRKRDLS
jgi:hypothetical protein